MFRKALAWMGKHKVGTSAIAIVLAGGGWYWVHAHKATPAPRYVLAAATKGTLISSVTGSGQISAENQLDVKAKAFGDIYSVAAVKGQEVKTGALLATISATDALKSVRDAQSNLASAQIAYDKFLQATDALTLQQAQISLQAAQDAVTKLKLSQATSYQQTQESKAKAQDDLTKSYEDAFNDVANAFLDFPTVTKGLDTILNGTDISKSESTLTSGTDNVSSLMNSTDLDDVSLLLPFKLSAVSDQAAAQVAYDANFDTYKTATRFSDRATIDALVAQTLETSKSIAQAAKSESNFLDEWAQRRTFRSRPVFSLVTQYQSNLATYVSQTNNHLSTLLSIERTLQDDQLAITNADRTLTQMDQNNPLDLAAAQANVAERQAALDKLNAGVDPLDLRSQQLTLQQRRNALYDAQAKLADYSVRAPFDGVVADVAVKKGDSVSNGGTVVTLITKDQTAKISLNEVDVAKVKVGDKVSLTFDAIDGLSLTGTVGDIDAIGAVSQGVVTYGVTLSFDTQDDRVKPGMSVSAAIVTDAKTDVLLVPSGAVKSGNGGSYVLMFDAPLDGGTSPQGAVSATPPRQQPVEIGISDDTSTEIVSGLKEGDEVVVRTITATTATAAAPAAPSLFGAPSGRGGNAGFGGATAVRRVGG